MASALKNLEAAQGFLQGVRTLSSYGAVEDKQAHGVLRCLERSAALTPAQGAAFVQSLDPSVWRREY